MALIGTDTARPLRGQALQVRSKPVYWQTGVVIWRTEPPKPSQHGPLATFWIPICWLN